MVNKDLCIGCGMCASVCPVGAISMVNGLAEIDYDICTRCHTCEMVCPTMAIKILSEEEYEEYKINKQKELQQLATKQPTNGKIENNVKVENDANVKTSSNVKNVVGSVNIDTNNNAKF